MQLNAGIILGGDNVLDSITRAQQPYMNDIAMQGARQDLQIKDQQRQQAAVATLAKMVVTSPDRAAAYRQALQIAGTMGMPTMGLPAEYNDDIGAQLEMVVRATSQPQEMTEYERLRMRLPENLRPIADLTRAGLEARAGRESSFEQIVNAMVESGEIDRATAIAIRSGRVVIDPTFGTVIDKATGQPWRGAPTQMQTTPIPQPGTPQPAPQPGAMQTAPQPGVAQAAPTPQSGAAPQERMPTLYELTESGTGAVSSLGELVTDILGQISPSFAGEISNPGIVEIRQMFEAATQNVVAALSNNSKYPVGEMEYIKRMIGIAPSAFQSPEGLRARMRGIDSYLRVQLDSSRRIAMNGNAPKDMRADAFQKIAAIEQFLELMGVPQGSKFWQGQGQPQQGTPAPAPTQGTQPAAAQPAMTKPADAPPTPSGLSDEEWWGIWQSWTPDERRQFQEAQ